MKNYKMLPIRNSEKLASKLNELLANYSILYQNMRGYHWNVRGANFFELHEKFEEIYKDSLEKIDDVAERILTLGHCPYHKYSDFIKVATIKESAGGKDGVEGVKNLLESLNILLNLEKEILALASESDDEGTVTLVSDYIQQQEKTFWMFNAFLDE